LGKVRCLYENFSELGRKGKSLFGCSKCNKTSEVFYNEICEDCFYEVQKEKGCVCPFVKMKQKELYYCSLCEKFHSSSDSVICKECVKKQDVYIQKKEAFFGVGLPSMFFGIIIGFVLG